MEQKKSVCRSAIFKKTGSGNYGPYHIFEISFDNGDKGDYLAKSNPQQTFKEGVEVDYTIEKKENGQYVNYSIKPIQAAFVPGKGNPAIEHKRVALKCAVDLAAAKIIDKKEIATYSESFMKFLNA